ncbi:MAG: hypothetical protein PUB22_08740 [Clostridiales bacterium]|nr:hypothetical protein [Clostridiales bacterium]
MKKRYRICLLLFLVVILLLLFLVWIGGSFSFKRGEEENRSVYESQITDNGQPEETIEDTAASNEMIRSFHGVFSSLSEDGTWGIETKENQEDHKDQKDVIVLFIYEEYLYALDLEHQMILESLPVKDMHLSSMDLQELTNEMTFSSIEEMYAFLESLTS